MPQRSPSPKADQKPAAPKSTPAPTSPTPNLHTPQGILQLQRTVGNRAIARMFEKVSPPATTIPPTAAPGATNAPPIQRVFFRIDRKIATFFKDSETNTLYVVKEPHISEKGNYPLFFWVVPESDRDAEPIAIGKTIPSSKFYHKLDKKKRKFLIARDADRFHKNFKPPSLDPGEEFHKDANKEYKKKPIKGKKKPNANDAKCQFTSTAKQNVC